MWMVLLPVSFLFIRFLRKQTSDLSTIFNSFLAESAKPYDHAPFSLNSSTFI
jgi:hypothetical protein